MNKIKLSKKWKIISIVSILVVLITIWWFYIQSQIIFLSDATWTNEKYISLLEKKFLKEWYHFSKSDLRNHLKVIDELYQDWTIQVKLERYYLPEEGDTFSYREQYVLYFYN